MAINFTMPSLGADMEAGKLVEWLKRPGETVSRGDIVAVVETEKGAIDVEIFDSGKIVTHLVQPGTKVPVGTPLAVIDDGRTSVAATTISAEQAVPPRAAAAPAPASAPLAAAMGSLSSLPSRKVSPAARRLAHDNGIDLTTMLGTGPEGAIILRDVDRPLGPRSPGVSRDLTAMRHAIAAAMARSKREIPHYYLFHRTDVTIAQTWLTGFNGSRPPRQRLLFGTILAKATALALVDFPEFNGFCRDGIFVPSASIHLGLAISIRGGGLVAPAIHDANLLTLSELMAKMNDLVTRVRKGGFRSSEISDPTVTLSSLGERGVEALLPVIYPPQVAIIGTGTPQSLPWIIDSRIEPRSILTMALAGDHRVNDGHRGALLLKQIEMLLQKPEAL